MHISNYKLNEVVSFIERANYLIDHGKVKEDVVRHNFTSYLPRIFHSNPPSWVAQHISGGESLAKFEKDGTEGKGFIDNLVGLTAIEYEKDLRISENFAEGFNQVKQYCASTINEGHPVDLVIGVLSDTVRWYSYKVTIVSTKKNGILGPEDITLEKIDEVMTVPTEDSARKLMDFLQTYIGRIGARPLNAFSLAEDFGFESPFSYGYVVEIKNVVEDAITNNEEYARVISKLWRRIVTETTLNDDEFDVETYSDELYMITLGKLICANILEQRALISSSDELIEILKGDYFERKGFTNFVEYDYFGWLTDSPYLEDILTVSQKIQNNLRVYDFEHPFKEDLFGSMFAQLSYRTQRILLGQEWTPHWLANHMVNKTFRFLGKDELPQFIDMCCGSGVIVMETVKESKIRIEHINPTANIEEKLRLLSNSITGFDIDPLAVMLSKISWIIAAQDWIDLAEGVKITIPIYHADSLFAVTPLNEIDNDSKVFELEIEDNSIDLPRFILTPENKNFFDSIIDKGYRVGLRNQKLEQATIMAISSKIVEQEIERFNLSLETNQFDQTINFLESFINVVNILHIEGKNGIWAYILKNSYRPGLVSGQFNGLISNPPWLSLSKLSNNPYKEVLKTKAQEFEINPPGSAFLHIELATAFMLHGVKKYLKDNAVIGCIVPDSLLNGKNHQPFRNENYKNSLYPVDFQLNEVWKVSKHTFKNESVVLIGNKGGNHSWKNEDSFEKISGKNVSKDNIEDICFFNNKLGKRTAWDEKKIINTEQVFHAANFRQGADIMPRSFYCFDVKSIRRGISRVRSISLDSNNSFIISDANTEKDFKIEECHIENDVIYDVYTSKLLTPFNIYEPIKSVLPIRKSNNSNNYELIPYDEVVIRDDDLKYIIDKISQRKPDYIGHWERLNKRNKLVGQSSVPSTGFYIFVGTSGSKVCAAYKNADQIDTGKMIVDQTLNWAYVESEDEALYLTGLFNSESINEAINVFQPRGQQGARHIHSLPYEVTAEFNPENKLHLGVVNQTRLLIQEFNRLIIDNKDVGEALQPKNGSLPTRRSKVKSNIKELPSYIDYERACMSIYR